MYIYFQRTCLDVRFCAQCISMNADGLYKHVLLQGVVWFVCFSVLAFINSISSLLTLSSALWMLAFLFENFSLVLS